MSAVAKVERPTIDINDLQSHLEHADRDGRRDFKLVATGDLRETPWILAEVTPGTEAPYWHVAVIENGTGIVAYTRRAVHRDGLGYYLRAVLATGAAFRERPATGSANNPFHPDPEARQRKKAQRSVYFVQPVGGGLIKIGVAASVQSRLDSMQTGSPIQLRVIGTIADVGQDRETELHRRFAAARSHGEWFRPVPELLAYIAENARPA